MTRGGQAFGRGGVSPGAEGRRSARSRHGQLAGPQYGQPRLDPQVLVSPALSSRGPLSS